MTTAHDPARAFWDAVEAAWEDAGCPTAEQIVRQAAAEHDHDLAARTVHGWLKKQPVPRLHTRSRLHFEGFLAVLGADGRHDWDALLQAARPPRQQRPSGRRPREPVDATAPCSPERS